MAGIKRAFYLRAELHADTLRDLIAQVNEMAIDLRAGVPESVFGGYSIGGNWKLEHNPEMTHERYFELLESEDGKNGK